MTRVGTIARVAARDAALRRLRFSRGALAVSAIALLGALTNAAARSFPGRARAATATSTTAQSHERVAHSHSRPAASHRRAATGTRGVPRRRTGPRSGHARRGSVIAPPAAAPTTPVAAAAPSAPAAAVVSGGS